MPGQNGKRANGHKKSNNPPPPPPLGGQKFKIFKTPGVFLLWGEGLVVLVGSLQCTCVD